MNQTEHQRKWRMLFAAIRSLDRNGLKRRRLQITKKAHRLFKRKKKLARKLRSMKEEEQSLRAEKQEYQSLVRTVTRKLEYREPQEFQDRQKELDTFFSRENLESQEIDINI